MKLNSRTYSGNLMLRMRPGLESVIAEAWNTAPSRAYLPHSNMPLDGEPIPQVDIVAIEEQARAARSAWIGSKLKSFYENLVRKFERAGPAERENYLAASQCLADLEERIDRFEQLQSPKS